MGTGPDSQVLKCPGGAGRASVGKEGGGGQGREGDRVRPWDRTRWEAERAGGGEREERGKGGPNSVWLTGKCKWL